jgi:hypothetical protein
MRSYRVLAVRRLAGVDEVFRHIQNSTINAESSRAAQKVNIAITLHDVVELRPSQLGKAILFDRLDFNHFVAAIRRNEYKIGGANQAKLMVVQNKLAITVKCGTAACAFDKLSANAFAFRVAAVASPVANYPMLAMRANELRSHVRFSSTAKRPNNTHLGQYIFKVLLLVTLVDEVCSRTPIAVNQ